MRRNIPRVLAIFSFLFIAACVGTPNSADQAELTKRWNLSAVGVTAPFPDGGTVDFKWNDFEQFPHPTYKGGSPEAYKAFAQVFLEFFSRADNFELLKQKGLLNVRLIYKFPSGQLGLDTTFDELAEQLADPSYLPGFLTADMRNQLKLVHQMIHDAL